MRDKLEGRIRLQRPSDTVIAGASFIIVASITGGVVVAALFDIIPGSTASLIVSAILAIATFGYVLLTFGMATAMKQQTEHAKRSLKLQRKPDIVKIIEEEIQPRMRDIIQHRLTFDARAPDAYDSYQVDETTTVERFPELEPEFRDPGYAATISAEVEVSTSRMYLYYRQVSQYCETHHRAVNDLEHQLIEQANDLGIVENKARQYAKSAFALEPVGDMPPHEWQEKKGNIVPIRLKLDGYETKLDELKKDIKDRGQKIQDSLRRAQSELREEYQISRADLASD